MENSKQLDKEEIIKSIKRRMLDEHRKHSRTGFDWMEVAARKIYATWLEEVPVPHSETGHNKLIREIHSHLYNAIPAGEINGFKIIQAIAGHLKWLESLEKKESETSEGKEFAFVDEHRKQIPQSTKDAVKKQFDKIDEIEGKEDEINWQAFKNDLSKECFHYGKITVTDFETLFNWIKTTVEYYRSEGKQGEEGE